MKKRILLIGIAVIVLIAAFIFLSRKDGKDEPIVTTGIVEGTEVNLSSKVSGRISEFCCKEGDRVSGGHVLVRLDRNDIKETFEQARAGVLRAKGGIHSAEASVKNSEAKIRSAR